MSERHTYVRNTLLLLAANALVLAVGFVARPLIARLLGPEEYAAFALVLSTAAALSIYLNFSLNLGLVYRVAKKPKKAGEYNSTVIAFLVLMSAILLLPAYLLLKIVAPVLGDLGFFSAFVLAVALGLLAILEAMQQGLKKFNQFGATQAGSGVLAAVASVAGAILLLNGFLVGALRAVAVLAVTVAGLLYLKRFGRITRKAFDEVWAYSKPITFAAFASTLIAVVDKYFLAAFSSMSSLGYYDISLALVSATLPFTVSLTAVMLPEVSRYPKKILSYYPRIAAANTVLLTGFGLCLYYYADIVVSLLLGSEYIAGTVPLLRILALALPVMSFINLNNTTYRAIGMPKATAFYAVSLVAASIIFNWLLVPQYGAIGAAFATLATYLVIAVTGTVMLWRHVKVGIRKTVFQLALFALFAAGYWLLENPGFTVKTILLLAFGLATLALQRKLVAELIETVKSFNLFGGGAK